MNTVAQLAQDPSTLYVYGPLGAICAWFMWRFEDYKKQVKTESKDTNKEIRILSHRIDGMTRAMLADIIDRDSSGPHAKSFATEQLAKIEARDISEHRNL